MTGCICDVDLDLLGGHFTGLAGQKHERSCDNDKDDDEDDYGSRHLAFHTGSGDGGLLPDLRPGCIAPAGWKSSVTVSIVQSSLSG